MSNNSLAFSQDLAQQYTNSAEPFPVNFDQAWQWLGYSSKQACQKKLFNSFEQGIDYNLSQTIKVQKEGARSVSRPYLDIRLSIDCFKSLGMMAGTEQGKLIRKYFLGCEQKAKANKVKAVPQSYAQALMEAAKIALECERLEAEKTLLEEQNQHLSEAVDELFNYSSIIRVAKFNNMSETTFNWRRLKVVSQELGAEIKQVPCPRFQWKNLYSHDVWRSAYPGYSLPETLTLVVT